LYFGEPPKKPETSQDSTETYSSPSSDPKHKNELIYKYDNSYLWMTNRKWKRFSLCYAPSFYYTTWLFLNDTISLMSSADLLTYFGTVALSSLLWYGTSKLDSMVVHGVVIQRNFKKTCFVLDLGVMDSKAG
jgi:hypothetical protein